jgi:2-polyprenyl-6-methoxyphenol hydroxylase and related FAD-dependent oxidoreductases
MARDIRTPVLIVGGGPVGLGLAIDLGWRGIECVLVEQGDGTIAHPRANAENARTMEFFRRWGIADRVREAGTPGDFPHTVLYLTALTGFEIARFERPDHGGVGRAPSARNGRSAATSFGSIRSCAIGPGAFPA